MLMGLAPAPLAKCRVLELGCSSGGNVIPLAELYPAAEFVAVERKSRSNKHPFYVKGYGWTDASKVLVGQEVMGADGQWLLVLENQDYKSGQGVVVYNFEVEGDHTYFVSDGQGDNSWAWVHNTCVYMARSASGPTYIGIANNFERRAAEHLTNGRIIVPIKGLEDIDYRLARGIEDQLILKYGRIQDRFGNKLGGRLENLNRGISPRKLPNYGTTIDEAIALMKSLLL